MSFKFAIIESRSLNRRLGYKNIYPSTEIPIVPRAKIEAPTFNPVYTSLVPTSIPLRYPGLPLSVMTKVPNALK